MTKNQAQPARYRPGKAAAEDLPSEESSDDEEDAPPKTRRPAPPKASSFPAQRLAAARGTSAGTVLSQAPSRAKPLPPPDLEGFVTASEESESESDGDGAASSDDDGSDADGSTDEDASSSDDEPKKPLLRPTFISKAQRKQYVEPSAEDQAAEAARQRQEKADALLQAQLERDAAARAAGKKYWDDDDIAAEDEVDDRDGVEPEVERAAWKLRELKRIRRDRQGIEEKERQREEIERRREMTAEERDEEDRRYLATQKEEREGKGKMAYMQKYFHKGAFFGAADDGGGGDGERDEEVANALTRDLAGARFVDDAGDKAVLPEYMRIRDMTKLGRKGRTKYKDLKSEDTGQWGGHVGGRKRELDGGVDERFRPDNERRDGGGWEKTGANSVAVGERKRPRHQ